MPRIAWMIHHHDAHFFSIDLARVVHPFRPLPPHVRLPFAALGVHQFPRSRRSARLLLRRRFLEHRRHAHREGAFLGVPENDLVDGREVEVEIDDAELGVCVERHLPGFRQQRLAVRRQPGQDGVHRARLFAAPHRQNFLQDDAPHGGVGLRGRCRDVLDRPVVVAVHISVPVKQAGVMRMIRRLSRQPTGRKRAVDDRAGGGTQGMEIGPVEILAADVEDRERLAIDFDGDLFRSLCERDLCPGRASRREQENDEQRQVFCAGCGNVHAGYPSEPRPKCAAQSSGAGCRR